MERAKKIYLHTFTFIVLILGLVRLFTGADSQGLAENTPKADSIVVEELLVNADSSMTAKIRNEQTSKHPIYSVVNYDIAFPDSNTVQMEAAKKWGVEPVQNREDAESRKAELVFVGSNPWFHVDNLKRSIPYLVPRASILVQDIGRAFYDSLELKGIPLHKIILTSVLRSKDDVAKLRERNGNATENSCHLYGTTVDICYNRYKTVEAPEGPHRRTVSNDTLKWILSEVLNDMRKNERCYVKYEKHQGCFHLTVR